MIRAKPVHAEGLLYVGTEAGTLYALDAETGQQRWAFEADASILSSPDVAEGTVYVSALGDTVYALDAQSGVQRWTVNPSKR